MIITEPLFLLRKVGIKSSDQKGALEVIISCDYFIFWNMPSLCKEFVKMHISGLQLSIALLVQDRVKV